MAVKMAVLAPIPSASASRATTEKEGVFQSERSASRMGVILRGAQKVTRRKTARLFGAASLFRSREPLSEPGASFGGRDPLSEPRPSGSGCLSVLSANAVP